MCVITAYGMQCMVAGCRGSGAGQQGVRPGRGMLNDVSRATSLPGFEPGTVQPTDLPGPYIYIYIYKIT